MNNGDKGKKRYSLIYADPPWNFAMWSEKGTGRSPEKHYQTQSIEYLKKMDIEALCKINCVLLMWATFLCMKQALKLGKAWGTYNILAFLLFVFKFLLINS